MDVTNWSVKRSGPSMTLTGVDAATGKVVKITAVKCIVVEGKEGYVKFVVARTTAQKINLLVS